MLSLIVVSVSSSLEIDGVVLLRLELSTVGQLKRDLLVFIPTSEGSRKN